jgi:hypothetical protein
MKKILLYIIIPIMMVVFVAVIVPMMMKWLQGQHSEKMRMDQAYADKKAREITQPVSDAVESHWSEALDSYSPPKVNTRRVQKIMNNRDEELEQASEMD